MSWKIIFSNLILSLLILVPLGEKWEIQKEVSVPAALFIGILSGIIVSCLLRLWSLQFYQTALLEIFVIAAISISLLLWRFHRDPERIPPEDENVILSPADGRVIYVKKIEDRKIPFSEKNGRRFPLNDFIQTDVFPMGGHLIGISMNFLDVHVNRAPISGKITLFKHIKGSFISLKRKEALIHNERALTVIENGHFKVGIVQIASRLVRKIIAYLQEGNEIQRGQRIGAIRFGSQVDLVIPDVPSLHIDVKPGEAVKAGVSIVARFDGRLL